MSIVPAERRARELLRSVVTPEQYSAYEELGYFTFPGRGEPDSGYAYLVYPHRPLVSYATDDARLLSEHCVRFLDRGEQLPAADDVLARWIALCDRERELLETANLNPPGHQVDPAHARRDIARLERWRSARSVDSPSR